MQMSVPEVQILQVSEEESASPGNTDMPLDKITRPLSHTHTAVPGLPASYMDSCTLDPSG